MLPRLPALRVVLSAALLTACATVPAAVVRQTTFMATPQSAFDTVAVSFEKATAARDTVQVDVQVRNNGTAPLQLNLAAWALRLPDASIVGMAMDSGGQLSIDPGASKPVHARFTMLSGDAEQLRSFELVIAGVMTPPGTPARVAGTIPFNAVDAPASTK